MSAADYRELGLPTTATPAQVKQRYHDLASLYHPDHEGGDAAKFQRVVEAYHRLKQAPCATCKGKRTVATAAGFRAARKPCPKCGGPKR